MKTNRIFWILTIIIFTGLLVPALVQDGMFLDGVTYSAISKNMANGIGSFWNPHYTKTLYPNFYEHPPMVFIIHSFFFRLLGDSIYTERIFSLFTAILTSFGIVLCWRLFNKQNDFKNYAWLPVLLWITIPLISWSYKNNLLENTLGVFTIFSVYSISKSLIEDRIIYLLPGSIFIVMAFLSKGPAGLFPVIIPFFFILVFKQKKYGEAIARGIYLIVLTMSLFYFLSLLFPESRKNIIFYFEQQLLPALTNQKEITTNNRFSIITDLIIELTFPLVLLMYLAIKKWLNTRNLKFLYHKESFFFLLIAISASFPLMVSLKQRKFYLVPSIPFYILSFSFLIIPYLKGFLENLSLSVKKWLKKITYLSLTFVIIFSVSRFGKYSRDEEKLKDIYSISQAIPKGTIISITKNISQDWVLVAYMSRIGYLSLDCDHEHEFFLMEKNNKIESHLLEKYDKMDLNLIKYTILKKKGAETNVHNKQIVISSSD